MKDLFFHSQFSKTTPTLQMASLPCPTSGFGLFYCHFSSFLPSPEWKRWGWKEATLTLFFLNFLARLRGLNKGMWSIPVNYGPMQLFETLSRWIADLKWRGYAQVSITLALKHTDQIGRDQYTRPQIDNTWHICSDKDCVRKCGLKVPHKASKATSCLY